MHVHGGAEPDNEFTTLPLSEHVRLESELVMLTLSRKSEPSEALASEGTLLRKLESLSLRQSEHCFCGVSVQTRSQFPPGPRATCPTVSSGSLVHSKVHFCALTCLLAE